jgi:hypothetical protein
MAKRNQHNEKQGSFLKSHVKHMIDPVETKRRKSKKKNGVSMRVLRRSAMALASVACAASSLEGTEAFGVHNNPLHLTTSSPQLERNSDTALFYAPPNHPTTKTAPMVAQAFYSAFATNRSPTKPRNYQNNNGPAPLSNSVLSSSDTLPSFPTAHGLLSPETVIRMEIMTSSSTRDAAVDYFLRTYKREGPMACLPMLSDPKVLPRLTEAMRDIVQ